MQPRQPGALDVACWPVRPRFVTIHAPSPNLTPAQTRDAARKSNGQVANRRRRHSLVPATYDTAAGTAARRAAAMPPRINIPPVTRVLLIALIFQSFLSAAIRYRQWTEHADIVIPYLTLVPQLSLVYPWTFLTSTLVEGNVFTLAIAGVTLYQGGRYLERAWSSAELAKFLALVSLVPNILTFCVMILFFTLTRNESWTFVRCYPRPAAASC